MIKLPNIIRDPSLIIRGRKTWQMVCIDAISGRVIVNAIRTTLTGKEARYPRVRDSSGDSAFLFNCACVLERQSLHCMIRYRILSSF